MEQSNGSVRATTYMQAVVEKCSRENRGPDEGMRIFLGNAKRNLPRKAGAGQLAVPHSRGLG